MSPLLLSLTFLLLATIMAVLAWIGWKYFYAPAPQARPATAPPQPRPPSPPRSSWIRGTAHYWATSFFSSFKAFRSRRTLWILLPIPLVGFIVAVTLTFSRSFDLDPLSAEGIGPEGAVNARLNEEKLVPPPDLPPSMFTSTERPLLEGADRDWRRIDGAFAQVVLKIFARMEVRGYPLALLEGYRSPERQELLAAKGSSVTNARAFQSKHQYGLAADIAPIRGGKLVISEKDAWAAAAYKALGEEAEAAGLIWGGRWAMRDLGHIEHAAKLSTIAKSAPPAL